jgi:hypothetical protein
VDVTRTVYGVYYPETRAVVDALWSERHHDWYERNYEKRQDDMHRPLLARWRTWASDAGVNLGSGYGFEYPTAGANEAIHALLALHAARGHRRIHVFAGEYEGYGHLATALGLEVVTHAREASPAALRSASPGDQFWISQPSAIDGNLWRDFDAFRGWLARDAPSVDLIVDVTYIGATASMPRIDLEPAPVAAIVWSLSKPFGVYYHRVGGLLSRREVPTLSGHHWFKNLFSVHLGERLLAAHAACELPTRYAAKRSEVIATCIAQKTLPASVVPSDVIMLAHAGPKPTGFEDYDRADGSRFCISPALDRMINT